MKPHAAPRSASGWASRLAAAELLHRVDAGADFETALAETSAFSRLQGPDRGFARAIASAALRGRGRIDFALSSLIDRPLERVEAPLRALLQAGCAQLWLMDVAEHAAVGETVEAARHWQAARRGGGLVNAVLRRAAREPERFADAPAASVWPDWLAARLTAALGPARAQAMARLQLVEPAMDLTLAPGESTQAWADRLGAEALPGGGVRLPAGAPLTDLPGYAEGRWWVQDVAASLPARLLGDVAGRVAVDLCAAPGGKAMQLAAMGARVTAIDISRQRLARLKENAARTGLAIDIVEADARTWRPPALADAVLLDAPCSALGVMRRHPEGIWRRDPTSLARFPMIQAGLLAASGEMLKPGGRLVYCVCTPLAEEGREIVNAAIASGGWRRVATSAFEAAGFEHAITAEGDVLTAPRAAIPTDEAESASENVAGALASDVFYIARLERLS